MFDTYAVKWPSITVVGQFESAHAFVPCHSRTGGNDRELRAAEKLKVTDYLDDERFPATAIYLRVLTFQISRFRMSGGGAH